MHKKAFLLFVSMWAYALALASQPAGLCFITNKGQWEKAVQFKAFAPGVTLFFEENAITYLLYDQSQYRQFFPHPGSAHELKRTDSLLQLHAVRVVFKNALKPEITGFDPSPTYYNYFLGNNPATWASQVPLYSGILYKNLYKGIDLRITRKGFDVKMDWIVHPGANPDQINLLTEGAEGITVTEQEKLMLFTSVKTLVESKPVSYNGAKEIPTTYQVEGNNIRFKIGQYNKAKTLIIDPLLIFSTYSGSTSDNFGFTATYDSKGHLFAGGICGGDSSVTNKYPTTPGAFQRYFKGGTGGAPVNLPCDMSISKYTPDGDTLLWATYLGGTNDDFPHSIVADAFDNLVIMGSSSSDDFPMPAQGYDLSFNGQADMVLSKLSEDGTQLLAGTYLGGSARDAQTITPLRYNYADDFRGDVTTDIDHNIWIASCTASNDFPKVNSNYQNSLGGALDGVLIKMDSALTQLKWSNLVGGTDVDALYSIKITPDGQVMVAGGTRSNDLKGTNGAAFTAFSGGSADGFIAKFDQNQTLIRTTYFGTSAYDQIYFVEFDKEENIFATGQTEGSISPTVGTWGSPNKGQFIVKFSNDLRNQLFITTFGSTNNSPNFSPSAFLIDRCENIYISGWGSNLGSGHAGTTNGLPLTPDAFQTTTDGNDFYLIVLGKDALNLHFASFFGGNNSEDHVDGGTSRFDKKGVVYQSVCASCISGGPPISDFPTTPNAYAVTNVSPRCSNAAFKIDLQISPAVIADFTAEPRLGCMPLKVDFQNKSTPGASLLWRFGDGATDTIPNPSHIYTQGGTYKVWLIAFDSLTCNKYDSTYRTIQVYPAPEPEFEVEFRPCNNLHIFSNNSKNVITQRWEFGDGSTDTNFNTTHQYSQSGNYKVRLVLNEGFDCEEVLERTLRVNLDSARTLEIPNVFTPNGDGINEFFEIKGLNPSCDKYKISIYNRWGQLLFESDRIGRWWNGAYNNVPVAAGLYFFVLDLERYNEEPTQLHGSITLITELPNQ